MLQELCEKELRLAQKHPTSWPTCIACGQPFDTEAELDIHTLIEHENICKDCICKQCVDENCGDPCYKCDGNKTTVTICINFKDNFKDE